MTPKRKSPNVLYLGDRIRPSGFEHTLEVVSLLRESVVAKRADYAVPHILSWWRATTTPSMRRR